MSLVQTTDNLTRAFLPPADAAIQTALLAAVVESSLDAIVSVSLEGRIESWNAGATCLFGYEAGEVMGKSILQIVPEELHAKEFQLLRRISAGERIAPFETTRKAKDGRLVPISLTLSPIRDVRGVVVGASKIARDISERRIAEKLVAIEVDALAKLSDLSSRLWRSSALDEGLNEMLLAVMELLSADKGHIQLLSSESEILTIVTHNGFQRDFLDLFHEVSADDESACGRALRHGQRTIIEDVELDREYENIRPIARAAGYRAVVVMPLIGAGGARLGMVSTYFSAPHRPTDREFRRLDLYLRQASDFIQRCQTEEALRRTQKALLDADHRKDEFLALLAHELRNPLAPIRYALASARSAAGTPAQHAHAEEVIDRQIANMSRLLDDLLDASRMSMGKLELKRQPTELIAVLDAAVEAARPIFEAKAHTVAIDLPMEPVWLVADPLRLAQIFSNLVINSAKYTDAGGRIEISASVAGENVTVRVRDNGIGIAREILPRLFTPFFQGEAVSSRAEGGLGIGLSLARGLVTLHGGSIEAFSEGVNQGSEFVVQLPGALAQSAQPINTEPVMRETPPARVLRVLLVDDNHDAADTCAALLELAGHEVRKAYSGRRALELAENFRPHVAVLDIGMPDLNGYQVARLIRGASWGRDIRFVAVTGWGRDEDRKRAFAAGFDHHLTKPITGEALNSLLCAMPNGQRTHDDLASGGDQSPP
jgi:PAS domain S-box-containing protein